MRCMASRKTPRFNQNRTYIPAFTMGRGRLGKRFKYNPLALSCEQASSSRVFFSAYPLVSTKKETSGTSTAPEVRSSSESGAAPAAAPHENYFSSSIEPVKLPSGVSSR